MPEMAEVFISALTRGFPTQNWLSDLNGRGFPSEISSLRPDTFQVLILGYGRGSIGESVDAFVSGFWLAGWLEVDGMDFIHRRARYSEESDENKGLNE